MVKRNRNKGGKQNMEINTILPYIYGAVSIFLIILLWIAYMVFKLKRKIEKEIDNETKPMYVPQQYQRQFPQNPQYQYN